MWICRTRPYNPKTKPSGTDACQSNITQIPEYDRRNSEWWRSTSHKAVNGQITFDYSNDDGIIAIGSGDALFDTKWSQAGGSSIYAYRDPPSIEGIAIATGALRISDIRDAARFDYSSRHRKPQEGQILLVKNARGLYAALKIRDIKSAGHSDSVDEVTFDYVILEDGSRNFSEISETQVIDGTFSARVLLIGAGFSRNWGGLLANEVGGQILAHPDVQARPKLRELILREPSFEDALEKTRTGLFEAEDAAAMETAIKASFDAMDADFCSPTPQVLGATINDFIARFCPGAVGIGTGYVFSLNQDLLLERIYGTQPTRQQLTVPGLLWAEQPPPAPAAAHHIPSAGLADPSIDEPQLLRHFNHVKLHGSINWHSSDGASSMIMGRRKPLTIARSPMIGWYHQVFERVLFSGDVRLMVIGYGWGDEHINGPIADAIQNHRLQVYSWNPSHPKDMLKGVARGDDILPGIMGFTTRSMAEVMPHTPMNPGSAHYDSIVRDFF